MKTYRIFISSPGDVRAEREIAARVIARTEAWFGGRAKLDGFFWEHEPMLMTQGDFQAQIPCPSEFDLFVCILWSRLGSRLHPDRHKRPDGSTYASGTEYEFEQAFFAFQESGRPDMLVYKREETPRFPPEPEAEEQRLKAQWRALTAFCDRWFKDEEHGTFKAGYVSYQNCDDFERNFEEHLKRLIINLLAKSGDSSPSVRPDRWWQGSPYRGLQAFHFEHDKIFFGRTKAIDEVLGTLRKRWIDDKCPFVMIFGASGSGKSSLMRAGVLPWLVKPGVIDGIELWRHALLRPADHSGDLLSCLASALVMKDALPEMIQDGSTVEEIAGMLRDEPKTITGLIKGALGQVAAESNLRGPNGKRPVARLALALDQMEEVFTLEDRFSHEDRIRLFQAISALVNRGYVWVLATLRSDFYNRCEEVPELVELKKGLGQYHLLPPNGASLSQIIRFPAEAAGVVFEEDRERGKLEDVIAHEAMSQPGALPLLEYALEMLYQAGQAQGILTHKSYNEIGRVTGAIARKAEQTAASLSAEAQASLEDVLRQLILLSDGTSGVPTRRVAREDDLVRSPGARELVTAFVEARLFTSDVNHGGHATITLAHEALLKLWERALAWIESNRDYLRQRGRLDQSLQLWKENEKHDDYLLASGLPLNEAENLLSLHASSLEREECQYIRASRERARKAEQRRMREKEEAQGSLARSYFIQAANLIEQKKIRDAMPYLAKSLRLHRKNNPAATLAFAYLPTLSLVRAQIQHQSWVRFATFSPDNTRLATASDDYTARVWDVKTGTPLTPSLEHQEGVATAMFSPDGCRVVTAASDQTARIWDAQTGQPLTEPLLHGKALQNAFFLPDGIRVATLLSDHTTQIWNSTTGEAMTPPILPYKKIRSTQLSPDGALLIVAGGVGVTNSAQIFDVETRKEVGSRLQHSGVVNFACFSPNGSLIATASDDGTARVWNATSQEPVVASLVHPGATRFALFSPDQSCLATLSVSDHNVRIWNLQTGQMVTPPMHHDEKVRTMQFSPDGARLVTVSSDHISRIWDTKTGVLLSTLEHRETINTALFSPDGRLVVTASWDKTVRVWDSRTIQPASSPINHQLAVDARFSPAGTQVITGSQDRTARIWDATTTKLLSEPLNHPGEITTVCYDATGTRVLTACADGVARLWDLPAGSSASTTTSFPHEGKVRSAIFSNDGNSVATTSDDQTARVWNILTGELRVPALAHPAGVSSAAFSPDNLLLLTAAEDSLARVWDVQTGQLLGVPMQHQGQAWPASFDPSGSSVATAAWDFYARVCNPKTGLPIAPPVYHKSNINCVVFSPCGDRLVTASWDNTARVWEPNTGRPLTPPLLHGKAVLLAAFSPDGERLLTVSWDNEIQLFDVKTGVPLCFPFRHPGLISSAVFNPNSSRILTTCADGLPQLWDLAPGGTAQSSDQSISPEWLADVIEACAFRSLDEFGSLQVGSAEKSAQIAQERLDSTSNESWEVFGRWLFAPPGSRTVSPWSGLI